MKAEEDIMNRISFSLKDPVLQMGFEVICSKLARLEKEIKRFTELLNRSNVRLAEEQLKNKELEKEKCELLGLIQEKDKLIEKMKSC